MGGGRKYDEESLGHIYALLEKHELSEILGMLSDVAHSRAPLPIPALSASKLTPGKGPTSVKSIRYSQFSGTSSESRFSGMSTEYTPSLPSSISSHSHPHREFPLYKSGLNPTTPVPPSIPSPTSLAPTPRDTISLPSPHPLDCDSKSVASSTTRRTGTLKADGHWFCTFCPDHRSFSTKSDWKKHETRHHETGEDWPCPIRHCGQVFDRQSDFELHCKRHHPDVPPPTDIKIRLLPRVLYGCGFDNCKSVLMGWNDRCNHVADHMRRGGKRREEWKYSNMIHNLLRQEATRNIWKEIFSNPESKELRYQITWRSENTRVLKQKLECADMRPDIDTVLQTALSLREGRPFNDAVELHPRFVTPSQDSVSHFENLTDDQLRQLLKGRPARPLFSATSVTSVAPTSHSVDSKSSSFVEPHPGTRVEFDVPSPSNISGRRISFMDIDTEELEFLNEPDPQIPPGLDLDPFQRDNNCSSKPFEMHYSHSLESSSTMDSMPHQRRSSRGHILTKSIRSLTSRKSPKQDLVGLDQGR